MNYSSQDIDEEEHQKPKKVIISNLRWEHVDNEIKD